MIRDVKSKLAILAALMALLGAVAAFTHPAVSKAPPNSSNDGGSSGYLFPDVGL